MAAFSDLVSPLEINTVNIGGGSNVILTTTQANAGTILLTGILTANITVTFPTKVKIWSVVNNTTGTYVVTLAMTGGTVTTTVGQGYSREIYADGVTGIYVLGHDVSGGYATSFGMTGLLTLNTTGSSIVSPFSSTVLQIAGLGTTRVVSDTYSNSNSVGPVGTFQTRSARGTPTVPLGLQSGDVLASFSGHGYGTTGFQSSSTGLFKIVSEGAFSDTSMPTALTFSPTLTGTITNAEAGRFNNRGALLLGTTTDNGTDKLQVTGSASFTSGINNTTIGLITPLAASFTTGAYSGQITSTVTTGTAPFVVASTTNVANLNASSLGGATFASPGNIGTGTAGSAIFTGVTLGATNALQWGTNAYLYGDIANTIEQYNGTNAQAFNLYNTYTNSSNYERVSISWSGNVCSLLTQEAGTGSARVMQIGTAGSAKFNILINNNPVWLFNASGHFTPNSSAAYDVGSSVDAVRNFYQDGIHVNNGSVVTTVSATGTTVTVAQNTNLQVCALSASYAAMTVQFPTPLADGHRFELVVTNSVTTLTLTPNSGASVAGGPSSITTYGFSQWRYVAANTTWYQIG
jgi:hypothetical protein